MNFSRSKLSKVRALQMQQNIIPHSWVIKIISHSYSDIDGHVFGRTAYIQLQYTCCRDGQDRATLTVRDVLVIGQGNVGVHRHLTHHRHLHCLTSAYHSTCYRELKSPN